MVENQSKTFYAQKPRLKMPFKNSISVLFMLKIVPNLP